MLKRMRPKDLPAVPADEGSWGEEEAKEPIQAGRDAPRRSEPGGEQLKDGKRWSRKRKMKRSRSPPGARAEVGLGRDIYRTPPSSWTGTQGQPAVRGQTNQGDGSQSLERELEKRMFEWVQEENLLLKQEIERLRQKESASSWSQVSEQASPVPPPPKREREPEHGARFTPNGTRVPDLPPSEEVRVPEFPWWADEHQAACVGEVPGDKELGGVKVCPGHKAQEGDCEYGGLKDCHGPGGGEVHEHGANGREMTPLEARAIWLEREAKKLQEAMNAAHQAEGRRLKSTYWSVPFEKTYGKNTEEMGSEDRDGLKSIPIVLPKLVEPSVRNAPLEAGDWIAQLTPLIGDVSSQAASWWSFAMDQVTSRYQRWLEAGPLEKLNVGCPDPIQMAKGHTRLAQRITTLLLGALPESIRQELVATRQLHVPGIMFAIYRRYQPGGLKEKTQTLADLSNTKPAATPAEAVERLRLWRRQLLRAIELQATLPDPVLQVRALDVVMKDLLKKDAQASFRISAYRLQHQVDVKPDAEGVQKFFELLLAEADLMLHARQEDWETGVLDNGEEEGRKNPSVKQLGHLLASQLLEFKCAASGALNLGAGWEGTANGNMIGVRSLTKHPGVGFVLRRPTSNKTVLRWPTAAGTQLGGVAHQQVGSRMEKDMEKEKEKEAKERRAKRVAMEQLLLRIKKMEKMESQCQK